MNRAGLTIVLSATLLLAACTADGGVWKKAGVEGEARDADLLACRAEATQIARAEERHPYAVRGARYSYSNQRHGLFGPSARYDNSDVRRQIEGEIEARRRARWRALFGACMEARSYSYESVAAE